MSAAEYPCAEFLPIEQDRHVDDEAHDERHAAHRGIRRRGHLREVWVAQGKTWAASNVDKRDTGRPRSLVATYRDFQHTRYDRKNLEHRPYQGCREGNAPRRECVQVE